MAEEAVTLRLMTEHASKGYNIITSLKFLQDNYPADRAAASIAKLSPELTELLPRLERFEFYPRSYWSEAIMAIAEQHDSPEARVDALTRLGRTVCEAQTNQFLRLVIRMMTPQLLGKKINSIWKRDHRGGMVTADLSKLADRRMDIHCTDIQGIAYYNAMSVGFFGFAFESMGTKGVRVRAEKPEEPWPEECRLTVTWS